MRKLLVVDDEPNIVYTIEETLGSDQLRVHSASSARDGVRLARALAPDVVLMDVRLPDQSGLDAFQQIREFDPRIPVIMMTAFSRTDTAIEAMSRGAFDYFVKPVDLAALRQAVGRALDVSRLNQVPAVVGQEVEGEEADSIIGQSPAMQEVYKTIGRVAPQDVTVLIQGESGTGKELAARAIYHYSRRSKQPFLAINCAALPESLLESELFGHERGAFTGADQRRIGKFEQVHGGTIFLDEIGDMSLSTQAKALRLLQQQQFERVGGNVTIQTDVRIIAATNRDLESMVAEGKFRQDLFYRLAGFTLRMPPLRERLDDVPLLTDYLLRTLSAELSRPIRGITDEARAALQRHQWPGNVRELYSAIRYAIVQSSGEIVTLDCLPEVVRSGGVSDQPSTIGDAWSGVRQIIQELLDCGSNDIYRQVGQLVDRALLELVLNHCQGNQLQAAERLGISRVTLRGKLRALRGEAEPDAS
ncbi:MAG: sigma-54 dependent transcriptional regulator [Pirellulales bacterium]